jgi:hypothetical protein
LCVSHARAFESTGGKVHSPETYDEALQPRELDDPLLPTQQDRVPYRGNNHDINAAIAVVIGATSLASCMGFMYCLPIIGGILGVVAMMNAKYAIDPQRTRTLGAVGLGIGLVGLIPLVLFLGYFVMIFVFIAFSAASGNIGP